jgi:hypothetical protein
MESDKVTTKKKRVRARGGSDSPPKAVVSCLDVLKKLACSVRCGGKTLSLKETVLSASSSSSEDKPPKTIKRKRPSRRSKPSSP